jgi:hypothetical protein
MDTVGAMMPNWFDRDYSAALETATAEEALALVANDKRLIGTLMTKLAEHDDVSKRHGWAGPTRSQVVRQTIARVLESAAGDPDQVLDA